MNKRLRVFPILTDANGVTWHIVTCPNGGLIYVPLTLELVS